METLMDGGNGNKTFDFHNFRRPTLDENMSSEDVSYLPKGRRASTASVLNFSGNFTLFKNICFESPPSPPLPVLTNNLIGIHQHFFNDYENFNSFH